MRDIMPYLPVLSVTVLPVVVALALSWLFRPQTPGGHRTDTAEFSVHEILARLADERKRGVLASFAFVPPPVKIRRNHVTQELIVTWA